MSINGRRIYLYIKGGCGNQFFQYAFARSLQEKTGAQLYINYEKYVRADSSPWAIDNLLSEFNTVDYVYDLKGTPKDIAFKFIGKYRQLRHINTSCRAAYDFRCRVANPLAKLGVYEFDAVYYPFPVTRAKTAVVDGYFESPKYFAEIDDKIKAELTPKHPPLEQNRELLETIKNRESVCVAIKRVDIEDPKVADVYNYTLSYYYAGIEYINRRVKDPIFIIFSDKVDWCRENLQINGEVRFETTNNPVWEKIRLMSSCKHFIIHSSTFSWWAQHLSDNPDKIVLAPTKWLQRDDEPIDIYEDNWLYITPDGEITDVHE